MSTPSTFKCRGCGKRHFFGVYVAAHTHLELTHTCDKCGQKHSVLNYKVTALTTTPESK